MNFVKAAHKWLSLVIGLQLALWLASGFAFNLLDSDIVSGRHLADQQRPQLLPNGDGFVSHSEIANSYPESGVVDIQLLQRFGRPLYRVETTDAVELRDARSGAPVVIDSAMAAAIAARDYAGDDRLIGTPVKMDSANMESRGHRGPLWRLDVDDAFATSLYISAWDGRVLERRNDSWRLFDIFWMLHIMDYTERQDFNNPFVIAFGLGALLLSVSGCLLLFTSFSRHDFNLVAKLRRGRVAVQLLDSNANPINQLVVACGSNLFDGLAANGVLLPSNCGGGGSCGLCQVRIAADAPVTGSEKALLSTAEIAAGYRLACQQRVAAATRLVLDDSILESRSFEAELVNARFVTPMIREIHLKPADEPGFHFDAGSYIQIDLPGGGRRSYSMANAPREPGAPIVLNVRLQPPPASNPDAPGGRGSGYLCGLGTGARVRVSGPYGDFRAQPGEREMVLIGGGAGMAPLRSMIVDQLENRGSRRRISFWYGARNLGEVFYRELFDDLQEKHTNFTWQFGLSEPLAANKWHGATGFISDLVRDQYLRTHPDLDGCDFYLCGPPPMLQASIEMLKALGIEEHRIAFDDFGS